MDEIASAKSRCCSESSVSNIRDVKPIIPFNGLRSSKIICVGKKLQIINKRLTYT